MARYVIVDGSFDKAIHDAFESVDADGAWHGYFDAVLTAIYMQPYNAGEPLTHAHWKCNGAWSMAKQCSNCSFVYKGETDYMGYVHYQASNYCPNCGAKMDEVVE